MTTRAAQAFVKVLGSNLATRAVTFSLNLLIARRLTPDAYALLAVQFHLVTTAILTLSREGFRRGCLRFSSSSSPDDGDDGADDTDDPDAARSSAGRRRKTAKTTHSISSAAPTIADRVVGVAWLSLPLGLVCSAAVCAVAVLGGGGGTGGNSSGAKGNYAWGVALHGLAALVELAAEPVYIAATARLELGLRAGVESAAAVSRCLATLALLWAAAGGVGGGGGDSPAIAGASPSSSSCTLLRRFGSSPALVFGAAQLVAALVVAACYAAHARRLCRAGALHPGAALARGPRGQWDAQDRAALRLSGLFGVQAAEKLVLAEGSKLALVAVSSWAAGRGDGPASSAAEAQRWRWQRQQEQQGAYGLVSNLGGLVARLVLQPLEDVAFAAFSRAAAGIRDDDGDEEEEEQEEEGPGEAAAEAAASSPAARQPAASGARRRRAARPAEADTLTATTTMTKKKKLKQKQQQQQKQKQELAIALRVCCRAVSLVGALAAAVGPWYARPLLRLAYGPRWADGPGGAALALGAYASYVAVMAVNGVAEAFAHAVLDAGGLRGANAALVLFAAAQLALSGGAVAAAARFDGRGQWGAAALVAADALGMLPRVAFALACVRAYFAAADVEGGEEDDDEEEARKAAGGRGRGRRGGGAASAKAPSVPLLRLRDLFPSTASLAAVAAASVLAGASWRFALHGGGEGSGGEGGRPRRGWARVALALASAPEHPPPSLARVAAHLACGALIAAALAPVLWRAERSALCAGAAAMRAPGAGGVDDAKKGR